ncbi:MAG: 4-(cytidine 5'-diphospho)-2-C-methyl-D-erythritol kinase, partial [Proteobacteria bacterium]|nr:4-(cytidine 5'-diphospho)-2-C-methyl-D-erythritol kinase [Pseudomonadota bacterium]
MIESVLSDCVKIKTPAKINLGLYITDKRPDGYHELCSIFLPVELYDVIDLKIDPVSDTLKINTSGPFAADCPTDESNIVFKVYNKITSLLKEEKIKRRVKTESGLDLHIEKNIPAQAGLGGGSSNAAGFLKALNLLWGLNMSNYELKTLVSEIGADVPFFIECKPALVKGIG